MHWSIAVHTLERHVRTVIDPAKFIARAAHFPELKSSYTDHHWTTSAGAKLHELVRTLRLQAFEPDFTKRVAISRTKVHLLDVLPPVLTHKDLEQDPL